MINLKKEDYLSEKILSKEESTLLVEKLKKEGKMIGLCKGSFDLLHPGHMKHLESAKKMCDILFVAIAKDAYAQSKNKNGGRPIYSDSIRAYMVSQLKPVDYVVLDDDRDDAINFIKPNRCIRGNDYKKSLSIEIYKKIQEKEGGEIIFTESVKPTTTELMDHIKKIDIK